jgi:hypothetical protein
VFTGTVSAVPTVADASSPSAAVLARQHADHVLGRDGAVPGRLLSAAHGVEVLAYDDASRDAVHCTTIGLSDLDVATMHPTELVCSVRPEQVEAARFLLAAVVRVAVERDGELVLGAVIGNATPLLAGTAICGVLLTTGLLFEDFDDFDLVEGPDGGIALQVLTVVPLTGDDLARHRAYGRDALEDALDAATVDLLDVTRGDLGADPSER